MHAESGIELLAPAGKRSVLEEVIDAGADAVYLGGKRFNMRLLRPDFNFSDREIRDAAALCHDQGVRLYVTVNNLYHERELSELADYLGFLKEARVDAVIVQDLALIELCRQAGLTLHASVQMGVNNPETVKLLEKAGFSRVILSKNLSLGEIREIKGQSDLGLEYFVHGDCCIAHTGQCWMSGLLSAESGNRGLCRKPCRWPYDLEAADAGKIWRDKYLLAHKDLCLYLNIPELIDAGVVSFKIEGRMRDAEYVSFLVSCYRQAIDRYLAGIKPPTEEDAEWKNLHRRRIRDFTTGSLYGFPTSEDIGLSGEREPFFPTAPVPLTGLRDEDYQEGEVRRREIGLSVKAGDPAGVRAALDKGVRTIIIPGACYRREGKFSGPADMAAALKEIKQDGARAVLEFPRIVTAHDRSPAAELWPLAREAGTVMVHDPGSLRLAAELGIEAWAGSGFNLTNSRAAEQVKAWQAVRACPSPELTEEELSAMAEKFPLPLEVMIHGPLCGMISDFCVVGSIDSGDGGSCGAPCRDDRYYLVDGLGQRYPLESDLQCRCHIYHPLELSLLTKLPWLAGRAASVRIEGDRYRPELLGEVIDIYQSALQDIAGGKWNQQSNYRRLLELFPAGLTQGPLGLDS